MQTKISSSALASCSKGTSVPAGIHAYAFVVTLALLTVNLASAQQGNVEQLAEQSAIVVSGKVVRLNASGEPLVAPSNRVAVISVERMYAGSEIAGDQTGRTVTVILSQPESVKPGEEAIFFGNPRFVGRSLTIADQGEVPSKALESMQAALERGLQSRRDRPILDRLKAANLVFRGSVKTVHAFESGTEENKSAEPATEHDPEWQIATVHVAVPLQGSEPGQEVTIIFPGSRDILWFNSPKLSAGQDAIFIAHSPQKEEEHLFRSRGLAAFIQEKRAYLVTQPFDVMPAPDKGRVRGLLSRKETK